MGSFLLDVLEFIAAILFLRAMARSLRAVFGLSRIQSRTSPSGSRARPPAASHRGQVARDPVCGMFVSTELPHHLARGAETLHFCSAECLKQYQKDAANVAS